MIMNNNESLTLFTLDNGLRCVHRHTNSAVAYCGIVVNAGSRDEDTLHNGLAHFVEHTIFKGTKHRSSWHISNRMESVGGELNAYTSKEETVIYTAAPAGEPQRAIELLADLVRNSTFPTDEIEREREVVCEEIKSYLDSPSDSVYDEFEENIYLGNAMAHNILGDIDSVHRLSAVDCRGFIEDFYCPDNMVIYISDSSKSQSIERLCRKHFGDLHLKSKLKERIIPGIVAPFSITKERNGFQAHTLMGARAFSRTDPRRFALFLLNNYLGGPCMNSRLNQELRERRGYVYTVDSSIALLSDCGSMMIYFGSDHNHVDKCKKLIRHELENLAATKLSAAKFERIRRQYRGQLLLTTDHKESTAMSLGKSMLYYNEIHSPAWTAERISEVSAEEVRAVAEFLLNQGLSELTIC